MVAHEIALVPPGETIDQNTIQADLDYAASMRRHHAGAVTMSTDYLEDARGTNPATTSCGWTGESEPV